MAFCWRTVGSHRYPSASIYGQIEAVSKVCGVVGWSVDSSCLYCCWTITELQTEAKLMKPSVRNNVSTVVTVCTFQAVIKKEMSQSSVPLETMKIYTHRSLLSYMLLGFFEYCTGAHLSGAFCWLCRQILKQMDATGAPHNKHNSLGQHECVAPHWWSCYKVKEAQMCVCSLHRTTKHLTEARAKVDW